MAQSTINIGTNKGNITNIIFDKEFAEISSQDVYDIASNKFGFGVRVKGWSLIRKNI